MSFYGQYSGIFGGGGGGGGGGSGTVTSVAMSVPSFLSVAGSPVTTSGTLAVTLSGTALPILNGGTGQTTALAAFNALSPMTTAGDILYGGASGSATRLAIGGTGSVLTVAGGVPTWATLGTGGTVTSVAMTVPSFLSVSGSPITLSGTLAVTLSGTALPILNGGTGQTTALAAFNALSPMTTAGDTLYGGVAGSATRLGIGSTGNVLTVVAGVPAWVAPATSGTVTSVSVVSANGFAGSVATATSTPAITLTTSITGLLKGNGTAISAATAGTDYAPATSGSSILYGNGAGGFSSVTVGTGLSFVTGTLASTGVTSVALSVPSFLSISGSPVTTTGTLAVTLSGTALPTTSGGTGLITVGTNGQVLTMVSGAPAWAAGGASGSQIAAANLEVMEQQQENTKTGIFTDPLDSSVGSGFQVTPADYQIQGILLQSSATPAIVWAPIVLNSAAKDTTATTNWSNVANTTTLTTSTTRKVGATSVSFTKSATGLGSIKYDYGSLGFSIPNNTRLWFWINFASVTNISNVSISLSADATTYGTNYQTWTSSTNYASSALVAGWNLMFFDLSTGGTATGTGWNSGIPARFFTVGANGTNGSDVILVNGIYFGLANPQNYVQLGTILSIFDATNYESTFQIDSSNTQVDGPITLTNALVNTYAGGFVGASVYRSTLTIGAGQAILGLDDPNGNVLAGSVSTEQDVRLTRYFRDALSSNTLSSSISVNTTQNYSCYSTTTNTIVISDAGDTHLNLLSGDTVHCFSTNYVGGTPYYIYLGDFILTSNSTYSSPNTTLTGTGGVPAGVAAGSLVVKKNLVTAKYSAVATATTNESFNNLTAIASPDGILAYGTNYPLPYSNNIYCLYNLNGNTLNSVGSGPALTTVGTPTLNSQFKNGYTAGSNFANSNYFRAVGSSTTFLGGNLTISFWLYSTTNAQDYYLGTQSAANQGFYFANDGSGHIYTNWESITITSSAAYTLNAWNHVVLTWIPNGAMILYLNGVNVGTATANSNLNTGSDLFLGLVGNTATGATSTATRLAQVIGWTGSILNISQVQQLYNNGLARIVGVPSASMLKYRYQNTGVSGSKVSLFAQLATDTAAISPFIQQMSCIKTS